MWNKAILTINEYENIGEKTAEDESVTARDMQDPTRVR